MRRWIARQFQQDRRWSTLGQFVVLGCLAFSISSDFIWPFGPGYDGTAGDRIAQELLDQAKRTEDLDERARILKEFDAQNKRNSAALSKELAEQHHRVQMRTRATEINGVVFGLALIPLAYDAYRINRGKRWLKTGRCGECGYDLRESPERCPECGTANPRAV